MNGKVIVSILELCVLRGHMIDLVIFGAKRTSCEQKGLPCLFVCQSVNEMRSLNYWDSELCSMRIFCHKFIDIQSKQTNEAKIKRNSNLYIHIWLYLKVFFYISKNTQFFPIKISTASMKFEHVSSNGNAPNEKGTPFLC